eukprot:3817677-Alexandrium_andersonii.AAC.1
MVRLAEALGVKTDGCSYDFLSQQAHPLAAAAAAPGPAGSTDRAPSASTPLAGIARPRRPRSLL